MTDSGDERNGVEARLARIRGRVMPKSHNARTIAALASNPGCARRAVMDAAGVDKQRIAGHLGYPAPFGQSGFAPARGNAFEAQLKSPAEDLNLASILGWIDPPPGMTGAEAAALAEDPARCPPAGPATDPTVDNEVLDGRIAAVEPGAVLTSPARPAQAARVIAVDTDASTRVTLELKGGMGRSLTPSPGSVPAVGETVCYATFGLGYQRPPDFPAPEETPWTHGGPSAEYVPAEEDAQEAWS